MDATFSKPNYIDRQRAREALRDLTDEYGPYGALHLIANNLIPQSELPEEEAFWNYVLQMLKTVKTH